MGQQKKPVVEFSNVFFRYREDAPWVLKDCTFTIYENEWVAIIGHNGSGKSTIAKLMNGLLFPEKGQIKVNGVEINEETVWDIRRDIGMVFQNPDNQFVGATVQDDVAFGMENRGVPREEMHKRIDESLSIVGMEIYRQAEPYRLSGGQKQRVAIAGVLAVFPQVLILDEATSMLDPIGRREIMHTVTNIRKQHQLSLVTITHDLNEIKQAERVIVINQGEIWDIAAPRHIFKKQTDLQNMGLDVPFITSLNTELRKLGLALENEALNQEELLEELWILRSKM